VHSFAGRFRGLACDKRLGRFVLPSRSRPRSARIDLSRPAYPTLDEASSLRPPKIGHLNPKISDRVPDLRSERSLEFDSLLVLRGLPTGPVFTHLGKTGELSLKPLAMTGTPDVAHLV
jgi:hypothetical protein